MIYFLKLEHGKFYVDFTNNFNKRLESRINDNGAK